MNLLLLTLSLVAVVSANVRFPICGSDRIQPQKKFNVTAFLGHWHVVADYNVQGKAFSKYVEPRDMQANFSRKKDGSLAFKTGAELTVRLMGYEVIKHCFSGSGRLAIPDPNREAHWQMAFDTWFPYSPASYVRDYYILSTDYLHYAILYTCWETVKDGSCHPESSFAWVLSRHHKGHGQKHWEQVKAASQRACLNPEKFQDRTGPKNCSL